MVHNGRFVGIWPNITIFAGFSCKFFAYTLHCTLYTRALTRAGHHGHKGLSGPHAQHELLCSLRLTRSEALEMCRLVLVLASIDLEQHLYASAKALNRSSSSHVLQVVSMDEAVASTHRHLKVLIGFKKRGKNLVWWIRVLNSQTAGVEGWQRTLIPQWRSRIIARHKCCIKWMLVWNSSTKACTHTQAYISTLTGESWGHARSMSRRNAWSHRQTQNTSKQTLLKIHTHIALLKIHTQSHWCMHPHMLGLDLVFQPPACCCAYRPG